MESRVVQCSSADHHFVTFSGKIDIFATKAAGLLYFLTPQNAVYFFPPLGCCWSLLKDDVCLTSMYQPALQCQPSPRKVFTGKPQSFSCHPSQFQISKQSVFHHSSTFLNQMKLIIWRKKGQGGVYYYFSFQDFCQGLRAMACSLLLSCVGLGNFYQKNSKLFMQDINL